MNRKITYRTGSQSSVVERTWLLQGCQRITEAISLLAQANQCVNRHEAVQLDYRELNTMLKKMHDAVLAHAQQKPIGIEKPQREVSHVS